MKVNMVHGGGGGGGGGESWHGTSVVGLSATGGSPVMIDPHTSL